MYLPHGIEIKIKKDLNKDKIKELKYNYSQSHFVLLSDKELYLWETKPLKLILNIEKDESNMEIFGIFCSVVWTNKNYIAVSTNKSWLYIYKLNISYDVIENELNNVVLDQISLQKISGNITCISSLGNTIWISNNEGIIEIIKCPDNENKNLSRICININEICFTWKYEIPDNNKVITCSEKCYIKYMSCTNWNGVVCILSDDRCGILCYMGKLEEYMMIKKEFFFVIVKDKSPITYAISNGINKNIIFGTKFGDVLGYGLDKTNLTYTHCCSYIIDKSRYNYEKSSVKMMKWTDDYKCLAVLWENNIIIIFSIYGYNLSIIIPDHHKTYQINTFDWSINNYYLTYSGYNIENNKNLLINIPLLKVTCNSNCIVLNNNDCIYISIKEELRTNEFLIKENFNKIIIPEEYIKYIESIKDISINLITLNIIIIGKDKILMYNMLKQIYDKVDINNKIISKIKFYQNYICLGINVMSPLKEPLNNDSIIFINENNVVMENKIIYNMENKITYIDICNDIICILYINNEFSLFKILPNNSTLDILNLLNIRTNLKSYPSQLLLSVINNDEITINVYILCSCDLYMYDCSKISPNHIKDIDHIQSIILSSNVESFWISSSLPYNKQISNDFIFIYCGLRGLKILIPIDLLSNEYNIYPILANKYLITLSSSNIYIPQFINFIKLLYISIMFNISSSLHNNLPQLLSYYILPDLIIQLISNNLSMCGVITLCEIYNNIDRNYLQYMLEITLHKIIEKEYQSIISDDKILSKMIILINKFDKTYSIIVNCIRKSEMKFWSFFFQSFYKPYEIFQQCLQYQNYSIASKFLIIIQCYNSPIQSKQLAIELFDNILSSSILKYELYEIVIELTRYVKSINSDMINEYIMNNNLLVQKDEIFNQYNKLKISYENLLESFIYKNIVDVKFKHFGYLIYSTGFDINEYFIKFYDKFQNHQLKWNYIFDNFFYDFPYYTQYYLYNNNDNINYTQKYLIKIEKEQILYLRSIFNHTKFYQYIFIFNIFLLDFDTIKSLILSFYHNDIQLYSTFIQQFLFNITDQLSNILPNTPLSTFLTLFIQLLTITLNSDTIDDTQLQSLQYHFPKQQPISYIQNDNSNNLCNIV